VKWLVLFALALVACNDDIDEQWELDHDRIIAVRAEPPGIVSGGRARLEVLVGYEEAPAEVKKPDVAMVVSPASLAGALAFDGADWVVTAPSEQDLAAARTELELEAGAPVPLLVGVGVAFPNPVVSPDPSGFGATKTVWLGEDRVNPPLSGLTIDGTELPPEGTPIVISAAKDVKTRLEVVADEELDIVNWLTSCGEMHDFDLPRSYITVGEEDRREGQLAVVLRDLQGGVTWRVWPLSAQ